MRGYLFLIYQKNLNLHKFEPPICRYILFRVEGVVRIKERVFG